ncbi:MAG: hypothetical protein L3J91_00815, partial [Thermoplasmata archaeon]|nr:hypothetical protein [Thermoplasmata archaeon]
MRRNFLRWAPVLALLVLVAVPIPSGPAHALLPLTPKALPGAIGPQIRATPRIGAAPGPAYYTESTINYTSSVDAFPLSYTEVLPAYYVPTTRYPMAVELHGIAVTES